MHSAWTDHRLKYNGSEIDDVRLSGKHTRVIWSPDITFKEKIGRRSEITTDNIFAMIESDGLVLMSQRYLDNFFD